MPVVTALLCAAGSTEHELFFLHNRLNGCENKPPTNHTRSPIPSKQRSQHNHTVLSYHGQKHRNTNAAAVAPLLYFHSSYETVPFARLIQSIHRNNSATIPPQYSSLCTYILMLSTRYRLSILQNRSTRSQAALHRDRYISNGNRAHETNTHTEFPLSYHQEVQPPTHSAVSHHFALHPTFQHASQPHTSQSLRLPCHHTPFPLYIPLFMDQILQTTGVTQKLTPCTTVRIHCSRAIPHTPIHHTLTRASVYHTNYTFPAATALHHVTKRTSSRNPMIVCKRSSTPPTARLLYGLECAFRSHKARSTFRQQLPNCS